MAGCLGVGNRPSYVRRSAHAAGSAASLRRRLRIGRLPRSREQPPCGWAEGFPLSTNNTNCTNAWAAECGGMALCALGVLCGENQPRKGSASSAKSVVQARGGTAFVCFREATAKKPGTRPGSKTIENPQKGRHALQRRRRTASSPMNPAVSKPRAALGSGMTASPP